MEGLRDDYHDPRHIPTGHLERMSRAWLGRRDVVGPDRRLITIGKGHDSVTLNENADLFRALPADKVAVDAAADRVLINGWRVSSRLRCGAGTAIERRRRPDPHLSTMRFDLALTGRSKE